MTNEEAILHMILRREELKFSFGDIDKDIKVFNMAIQALEQTELKPSYNSIKTELDAISRQAAYKCLEFKGDYDTLNEVHERLSKLLPVSTEKTGRWEWVHYDSNPNIGNWHCSECNRIVSGAITAASPVYSYKYCPNCGAKMEVEE